jgi:quinone-modifying oxidoreductase subunit QmoC
VKKVTKGLTAKSAAGIFGFEETVVEQLAGDNPISDVGEFMAEPYIIQPDLELIREVRKAGGDNLNRCYQCATCSVVCNLSPAENPFPRKEMIMAQWGQTDKLMRDSDLWLCYQCNDCSVHCPRGARPGDVLAAIRSHIYRSFAFPSFMGKALASPNALLALFLVPVTILIACILLTAPSLGGEYQFMTSEVIDFNLFMPHSSVDALFVFGNIIIFIFAAIGFKRFWNGLNAGGESAKSSFVFALLVTVKEIVFHSRFFECETNKSRSWAHLLLLSGFVGAMITTGCVFIFIFIPHYLQLLGLEQFHSFFDLPLALPHPVKILGAVSGVLLMVGGAWMIVRRWSDSEKVGASGYTDNLFLWIIFLTGFTGMTSWLIRAAELAWPAYISYFLHLVFVYFLLWYMPYSKFAHMIYRTLALVYTRQIGRKARTES